MSNAKELLDEAIYAGNLSEKEEEKLYSWIESLILAKRKVEEYEAKAKLADELLSELKDSSYYVDTGTKDLMISMCLTKIKRYESGEPNA